MSLKIERVLSKLGEQSELERSRSMQAPSGDEMLAITNDTGKFFEIFLIAMKAKRILEIGTSVGYSTLWFANALVHNNATQPKNGKPIISVEMNPTKISRASKNFTEACVENLIEVLEGNAKRVLLEISDNLKGKSEAQKKDSLFDFIFLDADKENLKEYFDLALPMLRIGGVIATDNMLYPEEYMDLMSEYANYIRSKNTVKTITLEIGNGEEITTKLF
jgi:predicted O-methyltransferase YrrM